jgi:hypothetical protein
MLVVDPLALEQVGKPIQRVCLVADRVPARCLPFLLPRDRLLMELSSGKGMSRRQIGLAMGLSAGNVARRLRKLLLRLDQPVVEVLTDPGCTLPRSLRQIGVEHFIQGTSAAILAQRCGMTPGQVRAQLQFIRGWQGGLNHRPKV